MSIAQVEVREALSADSPEIAALVVELSQSAEAHCLHSWAGETAVEVAQGLEEIREKDELSYMIALREGALIGGVGCEFDRDLGRGWLLGPHVSADWSEVASRCYRALRGVLPGVIKEFSVLLNQENERARDFYQAQGFKEKAERHHEYQMDLRRGDPSGSAPKLERLLASQRASFFEAFDLLFPSPYFTHERLLELQGDTHEIFVMGDGDHVEGFCVACLQQGISRGEIQFLGVREGGRRRGLGRQLLQSGISWLREVGAGEAGLGVTDRNKGARSLYTQVGFEMKHTAVSLKLTP